MKERKFSPAELRRKQAFEEKSREMAEQGYTRRDMTFSVAKANIGAFVIMLPIIALLTWWYVAANWTEFTMRAAPVQVLLALVAFLVLTVVHEGIHGLTWGSFAEKHFGAIEFGMIWSALTPYCTCSETLKRWQYVLGAAMPTIILGFIPAVAAIYGGWGFVFMVSMLMILGGGGDALIITKILSYRGKGKDAVFVDHPYDCGSVVFEKTAENGLNR